MDDDGGVRSCSTQALSNMVRAFYANMTLGLRSSSKATKIRFLQTCVRSISQFRWSRWPFTPTLAKKLDACQRRFLYPLFPVRPRLHETLQEFYTRRHRATSRLANTSGKWSRSWASDLAKWHARLERGHDNYTWSLHILQWRGGFWLEVQRLLHSARGESRTKTRLSRGKPSMRWEEGLRMVAP